MSINVAGQMYQTHASTLARFPASLLGDPSRRVAFWHPALNCFFFDRHRGAFEVRDSYTLSKRTKKCISQGILFIYQSHGVVKRPAKVPIDLFISELQFFEMGRWQ